MNQGEIKLNPKEADQVRLLYEIYLTGLSLAQAGKEVGVAKSHSQIGRILSNPIYIGKRGYPEIIPQDLFDEAQAEREKRKKQLGRNFEVKEVNLAIPHKFRWAHQEKPLINPLKQANQLYQSIEVMT
ncbi:recombinase family protein [Facklamia languida]